MTESVPITYEWLYANGFHKLERLDRQPTDHVRRCLGNDLIGDRFMSSREDLCLDLAFNGPERQFWYCWVTRASSQNHHPSAWLHVRHLATTAELILLYEALTGRKFTDGSWPIGQRNRTLGEPLFEEIKL